jgi:hypothetical protein
MHSTRLTNPAIEISELPPLDLIILSHANRYECGGSERTEFKGI